MPRTNQPLVRGALQQVFTATDRQSAGETLAAVVSQLEPAAGKVARLLEAAEEKRYIFLHSLAALTGADPGPFGRRPRPSSSGQGRWPGSGTTTRPRAPRHVSLILTPHTEVHHE